MAKNDCTLREYEKVSQELKQAHWVSVINLFWIELTTFHYRIFSMNYGIILKNVTLERNQHVPTILEPEYSDCKFSQIYFITMLYCKSVCDLPFPLQAFSVPISYFERSVFTESE